MNSTFPIARVATQPEVPARTAPGPLVTAIVPAHNAARYVEATLHSLRQQTHSALEILVVDDGSTDDTAERVAREAERDGRLRLIRQANAGVAAARNRGLEEARGDFIAFVDADDVWYPRATERMLQRLQAAGKGCGLAYAWCVTLDEFGRLDGGFRAALIQGRVFSTLVCHNFLGCASAALIRRDCLDEIGGFDCRFRARGCQGCEDWDLYLRIAAKYTFCAVPEFLVGYRKHARSMSTDVDVMVRSHEEMLAAIRDRGEAVSPGYERFSRSSFYLYLSRESASAGRRDCSRRLLRQALAASPAWTLLRVSLAGAFFSLSLGRRSAGAGAVPPCSSETPERDLDVGDISGRRFRIAARLACQHLFHWYVNALQRAGLAARVARLGRAMLRPICATRPLP
jgi:glycosyltransferase involved in cell wall biosynthesis